MIHVKNHSGYNIRQNQFSLSDLGWVLTPSKLSNEKLPLSTRSSYDPINVWSIQYEIRIFEMIIFKSYLNALILKGNLVTRTLKKENEHFYGNEWTRKWWEKHKNFLEYYFVKYVRDESITFRRSKHIPRPHFEGITTCKDYSRLSKLDFGFRQNRMPFWRNFNQLYFCEFLTSINDQVIKNHLHDLRIRLTRTT